jgi:transposase-like protein
MKTNIRSLPKSRRYSEEFKTPIVKDHEFGKFSVLQLESLHGAANATIYSWIHKYPTFKEHGYRVVEMKASSINKG